MLDRFTLRRAQVEMFYRYQSQERGRLGANFSTVYPDAIDEDSASVHQINQLQDLDVKHFRCLLLLPTASSFV